MQEKKSQKRKIKFKLGLDDLIAIILIIFGVCIPSINLLLTKFSWWQDLFSQIRGELIGIGIGVLLINNAAEYMNYVAEEKRKAISKAGSSDNTIASEGISNLQNEGWLNDGSMSGYGYSNANWRGLTLCGAVLRGSDLQNIDLSNANLINTDLSGSVLRNANLGGTILTNVNLNGADLSGVHFDSPEIFNNVTYDENTKWPISFNPNKDLHDGEFKVTIHNHDEDEDGLHLDFH